MACCRCRCFAANFSRFRRFMRSMTAARRAASASASAAHPSASAPSPPVHPLLHAQPQGEQRPLDAGAAPKGRLLSRRLRDGASGRQLAPPPELQQQWEQLVDHLLTPRGC